MIANNPISKSALKAVGVVLTCTTFLAAMGETDAPPPPPAAANTPPASRAATAENASNLAAATAEQLTDCGDVTASARRQFPLNDFQRCVVSFSQVRSGGPPRDGIPSIDAPTFAAVGDFAGDIAGREPVIVVQVGSEAKIYPLRILMWHEIVNDTIGGEPVTVTYCPLCNASLAFSRRLGDTVLDFGTTGRLRKSDLIMYDRQSETWWQQYTGRALMGVYAGLTLDIVPSQVISFAQAQTRYPSASILLPPQPITRNYGINPYVGYDTSAFPFLFDGSVPEGVAPMQQVVVIGDKAFSWRLIQERGTLVQDNLRLRWQPGVASALDTRSIASGRDVGSVSVEVQGEDGRWREQPHKVTFAFVFFAFNPDGELICSGCVQNGDI